MSIDAKLAAVIEKYRSHPQFLGIDLVDPNQPGAVDDTLLHLAAQTGALEDIDVLVSCGARVNVPGDLGNTPLHQAAMCGREDSVRLLLRLGADPNLLNEFNQTPLQVAELGRHERIVSILRTFIPNRP